MSDFSVLNNPKKIFGQEKDYCQEAGKMFTDFSGKGLSYSFLYCTLPACSM